ncbi:MAG: NAD-dependent epimerase/dehydratase family protein [Nitrospirae bacterium]|nr:NAD-dependent epimerase/dehydratase family protein [Nitrospirota bacterium]
MRVLVTGGAGFIGSHSVEALLAAGHVVRVLDNFSTGRRQNLPSDSELQVCEGDIRDTHDVRAAMADITHVLHLAAQVSVQASFEDPSGSCANNIQGFVNVLSMAMECGVNRMVYASSAAVYGRPERLPLSEAAPLRPISPYGLEKFVNEQYASFFAGHTDLSLLGLRYFNVYGPRQDPASPYAGVISKFVDAMRHDRPLRVYGDGLQTRDFVYVGDVAAANVCALTSPLTGVCNIGTGAPATLLDLIATLSDCLQKTPVVSYEPPMSGDIPHSQACVVRLHESLGLAEMTSLSMGLLALSLQKTQGSAASLSSR